MFYAIIGAMSQEVEALLALAEEYKLMQETPFYLYKARISDVDVLVCKSGIGKVEAALTTTYILSNYSVEAVINIGSAGGLDIRQEVGDLLIADELKYHDLLFSPENTEEGIEPYTFTTNKKLNEQVRRVFEQQGRRFWEGLLVSGDQFVCQEQQWRAILRRYPQAIALDMEATAIAHVCAKFAKPFIVLRSLSDIALKEGNEMSFDEFLPLAAAQSAQYCAALLSKIREL